MKFKQGDLISYKNYTGHIKFVDEPYFTFVLLNSNATLLVYANNWKDVTVLELAQTS